MNEINVKWDDDSQSIIRYDFGERWTWKDFFDSKVRADAMIDEAQHGNPVGVIFALPKNVMLPPNVISVTGNSFASRHPRAVLIVVVTESLFLKALWRTLNSIYPVVRSHGHLTDTLENARQVIANRLAAERQTPQPNQTTCS
jgi:hypothetical protein